MSLASRIEATILYRQSKLDGMDERYRLYRQLQVIADLHTPVHVCTRGEHGATQNSQGDLAPTGSGHPPCPTLLAVADAVEVAP